MTNQSPVFGSTFFVFFDIRFAGWPYEASGFFVLELSLGSCRAHTVTTTVIALEISLVLLLRSGLLPIRLLTLRFAAG